MLNQALLTTLRILILRAGPEDFPYDRGRTLTPLCLLAGLVCFALLFAVILPPVAAVAVSVVVLVAMALTVRMTLAARKLDNRFQQTLNALVAVNAALSLAMVPPVSALAPMLVEFVNKLAANNDLANHPEQLPQPPGLPSLLFDLLSLWQFVVSSRVYARSVNAGMFGGIGLALLGVVITMLFMLFAGPLIGTFVR